MSASKTRNRQARGTLKPAAQSTLFMSKDTYKAAIQGLRDQGLEHDDAVETLKVGIREANGKPVPASLLRVA
jgi:hypothetical protein